MERRPALAAVLAAFALATVCAARPAGAQARELVYEGESGGVVTRLQLRIDGNRVEGLLLESGLSLPVAGSVDGRRLAAAVLDPRSAAPLVRITGELRDDGARITAQPEAGGASRTLAMSRVAAAAPSTAGAAGASRAAGAAPGATTANPANANATNTNAPTAGRREPALHGRWVSESQLNSSGGAGGFASMSTVRTMELTPDGRLRQWVRTVSGGGNWSADGGERLEFSGLWETRGPELWVRPDGQPQFVRAAAWRMAGAYLVLEDGGSKQVWRR